MSLAVRLADGTEVEALSFDGELLEILSPQAFAPGAPVRLEVDAGAGPEVLCGKTAGVRRRSDGRFALRLRLVNLRRDLRQALRGLLPGRAQA